MARRGFPRIDREARRDFSGRKQLRRAELHHGVALCVSDLYVSSLSTATTGVEIIVTVLGLVGGAPGGEA